MASSSKLLFALDYDETYTEDKELWDMFITKAREKGHLVALVTYRPDYKEYNKDIYDDLEGKVDYFVFTGGEAKFDYCEDLGLYPSVWIDDYPWTILN